MTFLDYIVTLLYEGLASSNLENLVIAFLFARQSCYEGPHVFSSYPDWFQVLMLNRRKQSYLIYIYECFDCEMLSHFIRILDLMPENIASFV